MSRPTIHVWGFYDDAGNPRKPDSAAVEDATPYAVHRAVEANIIRHGGTIAHLRTTRTLDGFLIGTEFEAPAHDNTARIWHKITRSDDPWGSCGGERP